MDITIFTRLWPVMVVGFGFPILFILGARYLAMRLAGRSRAFTIPVTEPLNIPVPRFASPGLAVRTLCFVILLGVATSIILLRFVYGLGAVTHLSDHFPWGLWIGFDVMGGVALAAGAFVLAATVHIFGLRRFEPLVKPAILTGLLGYLLVIGGLMVDLGRPYNVWRPLVHWQHHSVMWEVGLCVASYTTVLFIEFLPVILERLNQFKGITKQLPTVPFYQLLKKISIVFIILGVILSTLHQSSLGSLWVLVPTKLSPLWYSLYLPVFFWLSAVAVGLAMTIVESILSSRAFKRGLELDLLADLAKAAAIVLAIYLVTRGVDLGVRGAWPLLFEPTLQTSAFWAEVGLGVIAPLILFSIRPLRYKPAILFSSALLIIIFGVALNRLNVSWIGLMPYAGNIYFPSWMEITITLTLISLGIVAFGLTAKYLPVFPKESHH